MRIRRVINLMRMCSFSELTIITFHYVFKKSFTADATLVHRLFIFSTACADRGISVKRSTSMMLLVKWNENGKELKMLLRKYTRDIMVFSEFFIEDGYLSYLKKWPGRKNEQLMIDAGANIGCASIFLSAYFDNARVICLEPENSNFDFLIKNIQLNRLSLRVKCIHKALWNIQTRLALRQRDWSSDAYHVMKKNIDDEVIDSIETTTILNILDEEKANRIDFLKIDIEGAEKTLFEDSNQLKEYLPMVEHIAMEVHQEFISDTYVGDILRNYDFKVETYPMAGDSTFVIAYKK